MPAVTDVLETELYSMFLRVYTYTFILLPCYAAKLRAKTKKKTGLSDDFVNAFYPFFRL